VTYLHLNFWSLLVLDDLRILGGVLLESVNGPTHLLEEGQFIGSTRPRGLLHILLDGSYRMA
jgi:hypothetical protein